MNQRPFLNHPGSCLSSDLGFVKKNKLINFQEIKVGEASYLGLSCCFGDEFRLKIKRSSTNSSSGFS